MLKLSIGWIVAGVATLGAVAYAAMSGKKSSSTPKALVKVPFNPGETDCDLAYSMLPDDVQETYNNAVIAANVDSEKLAVVKSLVKAIAIDPDIDDVAKRTFAKCFWKKAAQTGQATIAEAIAAVPSLASVLSGNALDEGVDGSDDACEEALAKLPTFLVSAIETAVESGSIDQVNAAKTLVQNALASNEIDRAVGQQSVRCLTKYIFEMSDAETPAESGPTSTPIFPNDDGSPDPSPYNFTISPLELRAGAAGEWPGINSMPKGSLKSRAVDLAGKLYYKGVLQMEGYGLCRSQPCPSSLLYRALADEIEVFGWGLGDWATASAARQELLSAAVILAGNGY